MSQSKEAMKRIYASLLLAELAWRDDLEEEKATDQKTNENGKNPILIHVHAPIGGKARIWPGTKLRCLTTGIESYCLRAVGLSPSPNWTTLDPGRTYTLSFETLPTNCRHFNLMENALDPDGPNVRRMERNDKDIYRLWIY